MKKSHNFRNFLIVALLFAGLFFYAYYFGNKKFSSKLLENPKIVIGVITDIHFEYKQGYIANFFFNDSLKIISSTVSGKNYALLKNSLNEHNTFPVIYNKANSEYNFLLVFPEDFLEYGLSFPDSLYWTKRLIQ